MPQTPQSGRLNALRRYRPADDPEVIEAARELKRVNAEDYIRRLVDEAPPLSPETHNRLVAILTRSTSDGETP